MKVHAFVNTKILTGICSKPARCVSTRNGKNRRTRQSLIPFNFYLWLSCSLREYDSFMLCSSCYQELFRCPVVGAVPAGSGIATLRQYAGTINRNLWCVVRFVWLLARSGRRDLGSTMPTGRVLACGWLRVQRLFLHGDAAEPAGLNRRD